MPRLSIGFIAFAAAAAATFLTSCRGEPRWPAAGPADLADTIYVARATADGAEVVAFSATTAERRLGVSCDGESEVAVSPDGGRLYYGADSALHEYDLAAATDVVVATFPAGMAYELAADDAGREKVYRWRCGYRFRDVTFGPQGRIAFILESTECPLGERRPEEFLAAERRRWRPRSDFFAQEGAYLLDAGGGAPSYLGATRALYGFDADGALFLESKLTLARYDFARGGEATPVLAADAHELGWLPAAAVAGDKVVVVAAKAEKKSDEYIRNGVYVLEGGRGRKRPRVEVRAREPATRAALSPDGRYFAFEGTPRLLGEPTIYVVDLARRRYKVLVNGGRLLRFARGSGALFYLSGTGRAGDLFLAGLDGSPRRLTSSADILPPP